MGLARNPAIGTNEWINTEDPLESIVQKCALILCWAYTIGDNEDPMS